MRCPVCGAELREVTTLFVDAPAGQEYSRGDYTITGLHRDLVYCPNGCSTVVLGDPLGKVTEIVGNFLAKGGEGVLEDAALLQAYALLRIAQSMEQVVSAETGLARIASAVKDGCLEVDTGLSV